MVAGQVQCSHDELTANNGERIDMTCSLQYSGLSDAGWRVNWHRSDSKQVLASFVDDSQSRVKRSYMIVAKYKHSDGDYVCSVTSRHPSYNDSCTTRLHVTCKSLLLVSLFFQIVLMVLFHLKNTNNSCFILL